MPSSFRHRMSALNGLCRSYTSTPTKACAALPVRGASQRGLSSSGSVTTIGHSLLLTSIPPSRNSQRHIFQRLGRGLSDRSVHMKTRHFARWAGACARAAMLSALAGFAAADATPYERMAPLEQYLMSSGSEIALARSAAPAAISDKATVLTLDSQGYRTAVHGTNGFTCLVERSWMSPFASQDFWNPKIRGPVCYNPAASGSILAYTLRRTKLALAGDSKGKDSRRGSRRPRAQRDPPTQIRCDVLHDVEGWVPERCRQSLAPALNVLCAKNCRRKLGSKPARVSGGPRRPRGSRAPDGFHGAGIQLVRRNDGSGSLVRT